MAKTPTMIAMMARAIAGEQLPDVLPESDRTSYAEAHWPLYVEHARKALNMMLHPTVTMLEAARVELSDVTVEDAKAAAWDAIRAHRAMVRVAMTEPAA